MKAWLLVGGLYLAVTIAMASPFLDFRELGTATFPTDGRLVVWTLAWTTHAIREGLPLFDANMYFPTSGALVYTEHLLGVGLFSLVLSLATGNPILIYSLLLLASFWANAMAAHMLALRFVGRHDAALAAGLVFGWTFFRMLHLAHLHLQWTAWLPLAVWLLERWFRRPTWGRLAQATAAMLMQMLTSWYTAVLMTLVAAAWIGWLFVHARPRDARRHLAQLAASALIGVAVLLPLALPYVRVLTPEPVQYASALSADLASYVAPPQDTFAGQLLEQRFGVDARWIFGEQTLFLGWMAIALSAVGALVTIARAFGGPP